MDLAVKIAFHKRYIKRPLCLVQFVGLVSLSDMYIYRIILFYHSIINLKYYTVRSILYYFSN